MDMITLPPQVQTALVRVKEMGCELLRAEKVRDPNKNEGYQPKL